jgi:hypothetical protein
MDRDELERTERINAAHERARARAQEMCDELRAAQDREMAAKGYTHVQRGNIGPDGRTVWENEIRRLPGVRRRSEGRTRPRVVAVIRPRERRAGPSSRTSSADPPSDDPPGSSPHYTFGVQARERSGLG